jgi:putative spermidine/putrescine transport system ATP-binding protein
MRRMPEADIARRIADALATVQLPEVGRRLPRELSGGQQQRIALARCIVYQPSIILMDEPLGALDKKLRDHMQLEIKELHTKLGITVLYVTHDQEEAMVMSDRICLMNEGAIVQIGTPDDLYFRPESVFAADFLGESNILPAEVVSASAGRTTVKGPGGAVVVAGGESKAGPGAKVSFMVRPEAIRVLGEAERDDNVATVNLRNAIVAGMVTKLYAEFPDGAPLSVTQLTKGSGQSFAAGTSLRVGWPAARTVLLAG